MLKLLISVSFVLMRSCLLLLYPCLHLKLNEIGGDFSRLSQIDEFQKGFSHTASMDVSYPRSVAPEGAYSYATNAKSNNHKVVMAKSFLFNIILNAFGEIVGLLWQKCMKEIFGSILHRETKEGDLSL